MYRVSNTLACGRGSRLEVGEKAPPLLECTMAMDFVAQGTPEISALKGEKLWEFPPYNRADGWKRVRNKKSPVTGIVPDSYCLDKNQVAKNPEKIWMDDIFRVIAAHSEKHRVSLEDLFRSLDARNTGSLSETNPRNPRHSDSMQLLAFH